MKDIQSTMIATTGPDGTVPFLREADSQLKLLSAIMLGDARKVYRICAAQNACFDLVAISVI